MNRRSILAFAASVPAAAVVLAAVPAAGWFSGGPASGTTEASAGTLLPLEALVVTDEQPAQLLAPGGSGDAVLKVHNPNTFTVRLVGVTAAGPVTVDGANPGCAAADADVTFAPQPELNVLVPAGLAMAIELPGAVLMGPGSASACQGAAFSLPVQLTVVTP